MSGFLDEIKAHGTGHTKHCTLTEWLSTLNRHDLREFFVAFDDRSYTAEQIGRAMRARGCPIGDIGAAVRKHRNRASPCESCAVLRQEP